MLTVFFRLRAILLALKQMLQKAWGLFPHLSAIARTVVAVLTREPMLLLSDSILFEDFLGRKFALQYEFYKHWMVSLGDKEDVVFLHKKTLLQIFKGFLQRQFRSLPGEDQVLSGQFLILDSRAEERVILRPDWDQAIERGAMIYMSIRVGPKTANLQSCPQSDCRGKISTTILKTRVTREYERCNFRHFVMKEDPNTDPKQHSSLFPEASTTGPKDKQEVFMATRENTRSIFRTVHFYDIKSTEQSDRNLKKANEANVKYNDLVRHDSTIRRYVTFKFEVSIQRRS